LERLIEVVASHDPTSTVDARLTEKVPRSIAGMFDAIAGRYDLLNHVLSAGLDRRWRAKAVASLDLTEDDRLLDLCTGTGDLAVSALNGKRGAPGRVIGIDFAFQMLRVAQAKLHRLHLDVPLLQADAVRLPLSSDVVDAVTIAFGIRNVADRAGACREVFRVLKPGGRVAMLELGIPTLWGLRAAYMWYFRRVLPLIGAIVAGHAEAYTYLPESVGAFPAPELFARQMGSVGFERVRSTQLALGIVYLYEARKPTTGLL
jgi:demethylmenaquinone methyltransferase/2-methoxy-6-polyprenyl-1,4-benzoquinol methylase